MKDNWAVIGAGPAGIASVSQLLTLGVAAKNILWIDPTFGVGDFGTLWRHVSSNTKVKLFFKFIEHSSVFCPTNRPAFSLDTLNGEETCLLELAAQPLRWITSELMQQVNCVEDYVDSLSKNQEDWLIATAKQKTYLTKNIILAIGAEPKSLNFAVQEIPLTIALDYHQLQQVVSDTDCVAVFGASHSAILVLKDLLQLGVKVINFYQSSPLLKYAIYHEGWIENDNTGLKGNTAKWAHTHLDPGQPLPANLIRVLATPENIANCLPQCTKAVYAIGFTRRTLPVEGLPNDFNYDDQTGKIAPGLFGAGIAFPRLMEDRAGNREYRVGLWKFMEDLRYFMPKWLNQQ